MQQQVLLGKFRERVSAFRGVITFKSVVQQFLISGHQSEEVVDLHHRACKHKHQVRNQPNADSQYDQENVQLVVDRGLDSVIHTDLRGSCLQVMIAALRLNK